MSEPIGEEVTGALTTPHLDSLLKERENHVGAVNGYSPNGAEEPGVRRTSVPTHRRTFVGLGFGPIQAGLFLYEAARSECFERLVVGEIVPATVAAVHEAGGYSVNVAYSDRIESVEVAPVEIRNPTVAADRAEVIAALAEASEVATALPSVALYDGDESAPAHLIAAALVVRGLYGPPLLVYTGENTLNAADVLRAAVRSHLPVESADALLANVAIVDTVIGKMSGYAPVGAGKSALAPVAPGLERAFLVEAFNRILISKPRFVSGAEFSRGIAAFHQEDELLPFEEFKLFCHNGMHAMAAYLGKIAGCTSMAQLVRVPGLLPLVRSAVIEEAGAALVARYAYLSNEFSPEAVAEKVDDLIERMVNPFLDDAIARVARDPARKLGWTDRLVGAMNLALDAGITPHRYALGAAAALADLVDPAAKQTGGFPWGKLPDLWRAVDAGRAAYVEQLIAGAWQHLEAFRDASSATPMAPAAGARAVQVAEGAAVEVKADSAGSVVDAVAEQVGGHPVVMEKVAPDRSLDEAVAYYGSDE